MVHRHDRRGAGPGLGVAAESRLDAEARARIHERVVTSAYEIIAGKGATSLAVGLAVSRILEAVLNDEHRVLPVTSRLDGVHGLSDVCLSMPSVVGRAGVESVLATPLSAEERGAARRLGGGRARGGPQPGALTGSRAQVPGVGSSRSCSTRSFSSRTSGQAPSDQFEMTV